MLPIQFVIYCEHSECLSRVYDLTFNYSSFFAHTLVVLNFQSDKQTFKVCPSELQSKVQVLKMPDPIGAGAALRKIFPHLKKDYVFLIDARSILKKEVMSFLRYYQEQIGLKPDHILSLQTSNRAPKLHIGEPAHALWKNKLRLATTLEWGGLVFYAPFILEVGAFHTQLREESLMVDLSWRIQSSLGVLLESETSLVVLKEPYQPLAEELTLLSQLYPELYPSWGQTLKKFFSKIFCTTTSSAAQNACQDRTH